MFEVVKLGFYMRPSSTLIAESSSECDAVSSSQGWAIEQLQTDTHIKQLDNISTTDVTLILIKFERR